MRPRPLITLLAVALATSALAQDVTDDWDVRISPEQQLIAASLVFDSGVAVAVRCFAGRYDALLAGLPASAEGAESRDLSIQFGDGPLHEQRWTVAVNPQVAVSDLPARFARELRKGGRLQVVVKGAGANGANLRYVLDLPASTAAIDQTLEACDRPLVDPRDAEIDALGEDGLPGGVSWAERPRPNYPSGRTYVRGFAVISCLNEPNGQLRDCAVESQHPLDGGFGEEALRATRRARIQMTENPQAPLPTRFLVFRTNFRMNESNPPLGSRIPR